MQELEIKNAIIKDAIITAGDRGFLDAWLHLDYGGSSQGFGGYCLYLPKSFKHHKIMSPAGHFIFRCMQVADVENWHQLKGKTIRVKCEHSKVHAIGHIVKDDWFNPSEDFEKVKEQAEAAV
jgi:hypothetical protein